MRYPQLLSIRSVAGALLPGSRYFDSFRMHTLQSASLHRARRPAQHFTFLAN